MQRYTRLKADAPPDDLTLPLVVDAQLFRLEAAVRWLDSADARLEHQAATLHRETTTDAATADGARL
jgi:hypothetical protein